MFTGIITDVGRVRAIEKAGDSRIEIETVYDLETVDIGASIACSGPCLTIIEKGEGWFAVEASDETLSCTNVGDWIVGTTVNLERALKVGDELGGHMVSGHVDTVVNLLMQEQIGDSTKLVFSLPPKYAPFVAAKGSVALDGVSLTVNEATDDHFTVNIIPHTQDHTTFGGFTIGRRVNMEIDVLARYVARMTEVNNKK